MQKIHSFLCVALPTGSVATVYTALANAEIWVKLVVLVIGGIGGLVNIYYKVKSHRHNKKK